MNIDALCTAHAVVQSHFEKFVKELRREGWDVEHPKIVRGTARSVIVSVEVGGKRD